MSVQIKEFFYTILKSLNPDSLKDLGQRTLKESLHYLFSVVFIAIVLMMIISIPKLIILPNYINDQFSKFNNLTINITAEMKGPIILTENNPQIIIDTSGNITKLEKGNLLIKKNSMIYREFFRIKEINTTDYSNILENKNFTIGLIFLLMIFIFPMFLVIFYLLYFIKYIVLILLVTLITFSVLKIIKYKLKIIQLINIIIYASTIMIILELVSFPYNLNKYLLPVPLLFGLSIYLIPLSLFIIYFVIGIILIKEKY